MWVKYRRLNNTIKRKCNKARWTYINDLAQDLKENDPKPFWNFVKSKRKGTNDLISLKIDDSILTDDYDIACSMNEYFSSVFTVENHDTFPTLNRIVDKKLENIHCSTNEVKKHLLNLKPNKSPGPDNIPSRILKEYASTLAPSTTVLLNKSFTSGTLPHDWKIANVTPIHKKGSKHLRENYRPISLTSIVCEIGERIIKNNVIKFWSHLNILNNSQFGYLQGRSTVTQLLSIVNDWAKSRNSSITTDVIFLDLAKAFDSVPHERLLLKLNMNGIDGSLLLWFRTDCITSKVKLYADDTKIYRQLIDPVLDTQALQHDLDHLREWASTWQLRFNNEKCESMRITHSNQITPWRRP